MTGLSSALRYPVLIMWTAAVLAGLYYIPQDNVLALAVAVAGGFLLALVHLRNWSHALAAAAAPLPGVIWFGASAYALCLAFSVLICSAHDGALLTSQDRRVVMLRPLAALAGTLLLAIGWQFHAPVQLSGLIAASTAAVIALPFLLLTAAFDEEAIAQGNRVRERELRLLAVAARIAEPRWSISLGGIGLVLAVLGYFQIAARPPHFDWLAVAAAGFVVLVLGRDVRGGLGALAAAALVLLFTGGVSGALLLFLLLAGDLAQAVAGFRTTSENISAAWMQALETEGGGLLFAGLAAIFAAGARGGIMAGLHAGEGVIAALVLYPAFAGALHAIFPRGRSVEEIYGTSRN